MGVLEALKREGRTAIIATHDLSAAAESADRMVVLSEDHTLVADGPPDEIRERTGAVDVEDAFLRLVEAAA